MLSVAKMALLVYERENCGDDVVINWAHAPAIHVASHVDQKKRFAWFSFSLHVCGSVPIVVVLRLALR